MPSLDDILATVARLAVPAGLQLGEHITRTERPARRAAPPSGLDAGVAATISAAHPGGIYLHQADAIAASLAGEDVCLATATASGKSLAFMAVAAHHLRCDRGAAVLAVYPTKALIADQLQKWNALLRPLGEEAAIIDGGVPVPTRIPLVKRCRVLLMTPDVVHAWLLPGAGEATLAKFLAGLRLLVVDEAHAYEGVFGTNAAYLFRRLAAAAPRHRLIASTATVADPKAHVRALTGRECRVFGEDDDSSARPGRAIVLAEGSGGKDAACGVSPWRCTRWHIALPRLRGQPEDGRNGRRPGTPRGQGRGRRDHRDDCRQRPSLPSGL